MVGINMDRQKIIDNAVENISTEMHHRIEFITRTVEAEDRLAMHNAIAMRVYNTIIRKAITEVPDDAGAKILLG